MRHKRKRMFRQKEKKKQAHEKRTWRKESYRTSAHTEREREKTIVFVNGVGCTCSSRSNCCDFCLLFKYMQLGGNRFSFRFRSLFPRVGRLDKCHHFLIFTLTYLSCRYCKHWCRVSCLFVVNKFFIFGWICVLIFHIGNSIECLRDLDTIQTKSPEREKVHGRKGHGVWVWWRQPSIRKRREEKKIEAQIEAIYNTIFTWRMDFSR